jgi:hypothetical protein
LTPNRPRGRSHPTVAGATEGSKGLSLWGKVWPVARPALHHQQRPASGVLRPRRRTDETAASSIGSRWLRGNGEWRFSTAPWEFVASLVEIDRPLHDRLQPLAGQEAARRAEECGAKGRSDQGGTAFGRPRAWSQGVRRDER